MSSSSDSPGNHQDSSPQESGVKPGFYDNMRRADTKLTGLLKNGYRFSDGGDELVPVGGSEIVATPFLVHSLLDGNSVPKREDV